MSRDICIYQEFLTEAHKAQIQAACQETGFAPPLLHPGPI